MGNMADSGAEGERLPNREGTAVKAFEAVEKSTGADHVQAVFRIIHPADAVRNMAETKRASHLL